MQSLQSWQYSSWQKLVWSCRLRGLGVTGLTCAGNALRFAKTEWYWRFKEWAFDRRHAVDTSGIIWIDQLDVSATQKQRGLGYMATSPEWFAMTLAQLENQLRHPECETPASDNGEPFDSPFAETTFVDFGSGKGRTLLLAAEFSFKRIIGVEFSPALHAAAIGNIAALHTRRGEQRLRSELRDATEYSLPRGPLLLYFYNPFPAEIMQQVVDNIAESYSGDPRDIYIVYANPTAREVFDSNNIFQPILDASQHKPPIVIYRCAKPEKRCQEPFFDLNI